MIAKDAPTDDKKKNIHRINVQILNIPITPLTDEQKFRLGVITAKGEPKPSKIPLDPRGSYKLLRIDRYTGKHKCALCGGEEKSQTVVVMLDELTEEEFPVARDCLYYHLGINLSELEGSSRRSRNFFERTSRILGIEVIDTANAVRKILENFNRLISFPCKANTRARIILENMHLNPRGLAEGNYDKDILELDTFVTLHYEHRVESDFFEARWRALGTHPNRIHHKEKLGALDTMLNNRESLRLEDFATLRRLLEGVSKNPIRLRNPDVVPWLYSSKEAYEAALDEHYQHKANNLFPDQAQKVLYHHKSEQLGALHVRIEDFPLVLAVYSDYLIKTPLQTFQFKNPHLLARYSNNKARYCIGTEIQNMRKKQKSQTVTIHYIGMALWSPDGWQPCFNDWQRYSRSRLEDINSIVEDRFPRM